MRVLLIASSSGGHIYPAKEVGNYLKKCNIEIGYLGIKGEIEEEILSDENLILLNIPKSFKHALKNIFALMKEMKNINQIIEKYDVLIGFGGFITFVVSMSPQIKKKLFYLHEANLDIGDANLFSLRKAKRIFTSFKKTTHKKYFNKVKYIGNPVIESITSIKEKNQKITFLFGSLGSSTLLKETIKFLKHDQKNNYRIITSKRYYSYALKELSGYQNVEIVDYIDRLYLYRTTSLLFCRAGASTLAEIVASNTRSVVIPSPYVKHHHQERNAHYLEELGYVKVIDESNYNENTIKKEILNYQSQVQQDSFIDNKLYPCISIYSCIKDDYEKAQY